MNPRNSDSPRAIYDQHSDQEQQRMADAGEAAAVFLHDLGNALNNVLLDNRLLQRELPAEHQDRLTESCNIIIETAKQMQQLAEYRQERRPDPYPVELNNALNEFAATNSNWDGRIEIHSAENQLYVLSTITDLERVFRLLVDNILRMVGDEGTLVLTVTESDQSALLEFRTSDFTPTSEELAEMFVPFLPKSVPQNSLEMTVCQNIIRRMKGTIRPAQGDPDGFTLHITLPICDSQ